MEQEKGTSIDQDCIALDAVITHHLVAVLAIKLLGSAHALGFQNKELESKLVRNLDSRKVWERNWASLYGDKVRNNIVRRRRQYAK